MNIDFILDKLKKLLPQRSDSEETRYFKILVYIILGIILLMIITGLLIFFLNLEELEKEKVPDLLTTDNKKVDIIEACLSLQEKGLNVKIQVKHSSQYARGLVIDQKPQPGALVKIGRQVKLTVSDGPVMDKIGNYIGQELDDVRLALQEAFASGTKAILQIQEPLEYDYSQTVPIDHVIEQIPAPGTGLVENKITYLKLIVSLGREENIKQIDSYLGLDFRSVIERLFKTAIPFKITEETKQNTYKSGVISFQSPLPGEKISSGEYLEIHFNKPVELAENQVYGWFETVVKQYDVAVPVRLEVTNSQGTRTLFSIRQKGGELSIPYILEENSELVLYVLNEIVEKQIVRKIEE